MVSRFIVTMGLACETKTPKIVSMAMEALTKIISCGMVHGLMEKSVPMPLAILGESAPNQRQVVKAVDLIIGIVSGCFLGQEEQVHLLILKVCQTAAANPVCELHDAGLGNAVRTCFNILLTDKSNTTETTAKTILRKIVQRVFQQYQRECVARAAAAAEEESHAAAVDSNNQPSDGADELIDDTSSNPPQSPRKTTAEEEKDESWNDCLLLFRALCKMAARDPQAKSKDAELQQIVQGKEASLELLYGIIESAGPTLCNDHRFLEIAVKKHLCATLVHNGVSVHPRVFKFTLSVFASLLKKFKVQLRAEIGVFFSNIFLRVLESPHSTMQQKWMVLQLLQHICRDPQALVDLYVNYDCDLDSTDIFVRMVNDISKTAQGSGTIGDNGAASIDDSMSDSGSNAPLSHQEFSVRVLGLECLVKVLKSLSDWTKEGTNTSPSVTPSLPSSGNLAPIAAAAMAADFTPATSSVAGSSGLPQSSPEEGVTDEELAELRKNKQKKQTLEEIKSRWSLDAKRAIEYLKQLELIDDTPASLAHFLYTTDGLDKKVLGDFLGGSKPFNKAVLHEYVSCFSFAGMRLDEALRYFLGMFLLPGEGQVVDRIMENFGAQYYKSNSKGTPFVDAEECLSAEDAVR